MMNKTFCAVAAVVALSAAFVGGRATVPQAVVELRDDSILHNVVLHHVVVSAPGNGAMVTGSTFVDVAFKEN